MIHQMSFCDACRWMPSQVKTYYQNIFKTIFSTGDDPSPIQAPTPNCGEPSPLLLMRRQSIDLLFGWPVSSLLVYFEVNLSLDNFSASTAPAGAVSTFNEVENMSGGEFYILSQ
jgi:hypothetical protein